MYCDMCTQVNCTHFVWGSPSHAQPCCEITVNTNPPQAVSDLLTVNLTALCPPFVGPTKNVLPTLITLMRAVIVLCVPCGGFVVMH